MVDKADFELWWNNIGSGVAPMRGDDFESHSYRMGCLFWDWLQMQESELDALRESNEWVSVDDRLPKDSACILTFGDGGINFDYYYKDRWDRNNITHWKPIHAPIGIK